MPGTSVIDDIELIIEDIRGGGGKPPSRRAFHPDVFHGAYGSLRCIAHQKSSYLVGYSPAAASVAEHRRSFGKQCHARIGPAQIAGGSSARVQTHVGADYDTWNDFSCRAGDCLAPPGWRRRLRGFTPIEQFLLRLHCASRSAPCWGN